MLKAMLLFGGLSFDARVSASRLASKQTKIDPRTKVDEAEFGLCGQRRQKILLKFQMYNHL